MRPSSSSVTATRKGSTTVKASARARSSRISPARLSRATAARSSRVRPLAGIVEEHHDAVDQAVGGGDLQVAAEILGHQDTFASGWSAAAARAATSPTMMRLGPASPRGVWASGEPRQVGETAGRNPFVGPRAVLDDGDRRGGIGAGIQQTIAHRSGFRGAHVDGERVALRGERGHAASSAFGVLAGDEGHGRGVACDGSAGCRPRPRSPAPR